MKSIDGGVHVDPREHAHAGSRDVDLHRQHRRADAQDDVQARVRPATRPHAPATSDPVDGDADASSSASRSPRRRSRRGSRSTVYGSLTPKAKAGSKTVKVRCYLKKSGKWVLKKTVTTRNCEQGLDLAVQGQHVAAEQGLVEARRQCAPPTPKYAATTSGTEYLRVK